MDKICLGMSHITQAIMSSDITQNMAIEAKYYCRDKVTLAESRLIGYLGTNIYDMVTTLKES